MTLWRVHMEAFLLLFRHELLAQQVQRSFGGDDRPAAAVALMMQLSKEARGVQQEVRYV